MKISKTQAWVIVIALALIAGVGVGGGSYFLYFAPTQAQAGTTSIEGLTVVMPRFGSVNCETTGRELETLEYLLSPEELPGTAKTSVTCPGMPTWEAEALRQDCYRYCEIKCGWDPFGLCLNPCKVECDEGYQELIKPGTLYTSGSFRKVPGVQKAFTCTGTTCKVYAPIYRNMNTSYYIYPLYKIYVNGVFTAGNTWAWNDTKFCSNLFPFNISSTGSIPVTAQKGDEVTIWATAFNETSLYDSGWSNIQGKLTTTEIKLVTYVDGTKVWKENTQGCTDQIVLQSVNYPNQPLYEDSFNLFTDDTGQIKSSIPGVTGDITLPDREDLPASMDAGQGYTFIFEWKALSTAFGNIDTYQEKDVWVDKINRVIYELEEISTGSGSYAVPTRALLYNPQCVSNAECLATVGTGYFCNDNFVCTQDPSACFSDAQCGTGIECKQIGVGFYQVIGKCNFSTHECEQSQTPVLCCPDLCPVGQVCNPAQGCITTGCEKVTCPGECCTEDECYYKKDCPTGYRCIVSGTAVGACVAVGYCGDGFCESQIGETAATCAADCTGDGQELCNDIIDNDGDGIINEGCPEICWDSIDNDQDGLTDEGCNDPMVWLYALIAGIAAAALAGGGSYWYLLSKGAL